jgi:hypothetical protein
MEYIYNIQCRPVFLIGIMGGGIQLGPRCTAATNRPIMPAPGDYDDGEIGGIIGRGNRSTRRKPAPVRLCRVDPLLGNCHETTPVAGATYFQ